MHKSHIHTKLGSSIPWNYVGKRQVIFDYVSRNLSLLFVEFLSYSGFQKMEKEENTLTLINIHLVIVLFLKKNKTKKYT